MLGVNLGPYPGDTAPRTAAATPLPAPAAPLTTSAASPPPPSTPLPAVTVQVLGLREKLSAPAASTTSPPQKDRKHSKKEKKVKHNRKEKKDRKRDQAIPTCRSPPQHSTPRHSPPRRSPPRYSTPTSRPKRTSPRPTIASELKSRPRPVDIPVSLPRAGGITPRDRRDQPRIQRQAKSSFDLARLDYRSQQSSTSGRGWEQAVDSHRHRGKPTTADPSRKRGCQESNSAVTAAQPASNRDREYRRIEALVTQMERLFTELVDLTRQQETDLQTLRRAMKRLKRQ